MSPLQFIEYSTHARGREHKLSGPLAATQSRGTWIVMLFARAIANQVRVVGEVHAVAREIIQAMTRPAAASSGRDETRNP